MTNILEQKRYHEIDATFMAIAKYEAKNNNCSDTNKLYEWCVYQFGYCREVYTKSCYYYFFAPELSTTT